MFGIRTKLQNIMNRAQFKKNRIEWSDNILVEGKINIVCKKTARIRIGNGVSIRSGISANPSGGGQRDCLFTVYDGAELVLDDGCGISNSTIVSSNRVYIGKGVNIGVNCVIYDTDMHAVDYENRIRRIKTKSAAVNILDGAWICGHCIILKGVTIGERSVVAAGSVVTQNIPKDELWGGNPARFIKKINQ